MKISLDAAMRARDVSRPRSRPEQQALAADSGAGEAGRRPEAGAGPGAGGGKKRRSRRR